MDEEIDRLVVSVRADTAGFQRDVASMRTSLEGPMSAGAERAGKAIETSLLRAVNTGKLGFDDLKTVALGALSSIAAASLKAGVQALLGGSGGVGGSGGLGTALAGLIGGAPGRATGGPVSPGRSYVVGERGPELFVPTTSGRVETVVPGAPASGPAWRQATPEAARVPVPPTNWRAPPMPAPAAPREVRVAITVNAAGAQAPAALQQSSRQVARAVKAALMTE